MPDPQPGRFIISKRGNVTRKPVEGPKELTKLHLLLIDRMVYGLDRALPHWPEIEPHQPLTLEQAARSIRMRLRQARSLSAYPIFQQALSRELAALRNGAKSKAMQAIIETLDVTADTAAERKVRLEAADRVLGADIETPRGGVAVNVQVNNHNQAIQPGYIVRLPAPNVIEGEAE